MAENPCIKEENNEQNIEVADACDDKLELPSTETEKLQIFMPHDKSEHDPELYGKWMWFSNGDIHLQDQIWIKLKPLIESKIILLLESSTARTWHQGVIKCYTSEKIQDILSAGLAMQNIINENIILFYKTSQASKEKQNRRSFYRFITKYMLTVNGKLYERDDFDRWKTITGIDKAQEDIEISPRESHLTPQRRKELSDREMLPSKESEKMRYILHSLGGTGYLEPTGMWHLFCNIVDFDCNCLTELDRIWIKAKSLFGEGVFVGAAVETNAYFQTGGSANFLRRTVTCNVKDYRDIPNVMETGRALLERTNYGFPIYLKTARPEGRKIKFFLRYLLTEDEELYEYMDERWILINAGQETSVNQFSNVVHSTD